MFKIRNYVNNDDVIVTNQKGKFKVIEYRKDLSVSANDAMNAYYNSQMNIHKKQVMIELHDDSVTVQSGTMQWMVGNVNATTGVKGVGDFFGKMARSAVTNESTIKPEFVGNGIIALEPTYHHIVLLDLNEWENNAVVLDDGLFLACDGNLKHKAVMRSSLSSAVLGNEGLFNLGIKGNGVVCLESCCPQEELIEIELINDTLKIDGNMAIAWSDTLDFTVEKAGKTLVGSAASGEGLVNVYRGSGRVLLAPMESNQLSCMQCNDVNLNQQ